MVKLMFALELKKGNKDLMEWLHEVLLSELSFRIFNKESRTFFIFHKE